VCCEGHEVLSRDSCLAQRGWVLRIKFREASGPEGLVVLRMSFGEGVAVGGGVRVPPFNGSREKWTGWKLSFQAIVRLDDRLTSDILEPRKRGKDFKPDDVGKEQRAQERVRSLLVLSCNVNESDASFLVNNAPVGCVDDGVYEGTAAWSALLAHYESKSAACTMMMMRDVLEPQPTNETVAELAGRLERLARRLHSGREVPLICAKLLGICLLQGVGKDCAHPRGTAAARPHASSYVQAPCMEAATAVALQIAWHGSAKRPGLTAPHGGSALWDVQALRPVISIDEKPPDYPFW